MVTENRTLREVSGAFRPEFAPGEQAWTDGPAAATEVADVGLEECGPRPAATLAGEQVRRDFEQLTARPGLLASLLLGAAGGDATLILSAAAAYQDAVHGQVSSPGGLVDLDAYRRSARARRADH